MTQIYAACLRLYPEAFRREYGNEMAQVFTDCCREASGSNQALIRLGFAAFTDLIVNACAERLHQMTTRQWLFGAFRSVGGLTVLVASGAMLGWSMLAITVMLMIPWDVGIPPKGMFAEAVNCFFEGSNNALIPASIVLLAEIVAFFRCVFSQRFPMIALFRRFTALNLAAIVIGAGSAAAGMYIARLLFPNHDPWEGDQSYGVALVYWGLIVTGTMLTYFLWLAWRTPTALPMIRRKPATAA